MTWTAADSAELDVLLNELVGSYFEHRDRCAHCQSWRSRQPGSTPCPHVGEAISTVIDWRRKRQLVSRAEQLRIDQHLHLIQANAA